MVSLDEGLVGFNIDLETRVKQFVLNLGDKGNVADLNGLDDSSVCCLGEVAKCPSGSPGAGVAILNTGHLQLFLGNGG